MDKLHSKISFEENGLLHARLINQLEEGGSATKDIDKIDKEEPNTATITFNSTIVEVGNPITATVTQSNKSIGTDASKFTGGTFKANQKEIELNIATPGTYYLHILTIDKAGNLKETISKAITIKKPPTVEDLKQGNEVNYVAQNGTNIKCKVLWDADSTYGKNGVQIIAMSSVETISLGVPTTAWSTAANTLNNSITTLNSKASAYVNTTYVSSA